MVTKISYAKFYSDKFGTLDTMVRQIPRKIEFNSDIKKQKTPVYSNTY